MLDASIRLDVLNLIKDLRDQRKIQSILMITHDIASARYVSDVISVMYGGIIVEFGKTEDIVHNPKHPYTKQLLSAAPDPAKFKGHKEVKNDEIDKLSCISKKVKPFDNSKEYISCRFAARCPYAKEICVSKIPPNTNIDGNNVVCHMYNDEYKTSNDIS